MRETSTQINEQQTFERRGINEAKRDIDKVEYNPIRADQEQIASYPHVANDKKQVGEDNNTTNVRR